MKTTEWKKSFEAFIKAEFPILSLNRDSDSYTDAITWLMYAAYIEGAHQTCAYITGRPDDD